MNMKLPADMKMTAKPVQSSTLVYGIAEPFEGKCIDLQ
jgi:hypothetical protein